jgi:rsbT co-antagonist protein RsbR
MAGTTETDTESLTRENERLKGRIAELEREAAARRGVAPAPPLPDALDALDALEKTVPYRALFESLPIAIGVYRPDGTAVAANAANLSLLNAKREGIVGKHNLLKDPQAIELGYAESFLRATRGEIVKMPPTSYDTAKAELDRIEDTTFWSETTYFPIHDDAGAELIVEITTDVTERLAAEEAVRESAELLHEVTDNFPHVMYARDLRGRYILLNRKGRIAAGYSTWEEVKGKSVFDIFPKHLADIFVASDSRVLESGQPVDTEDRVEEAGGPRYYLSTKFPLRNAEGQIYAICGVATDITQHKRSEEENHRLQEQMLRVKEDTLQALSTPLIPIARGVVAMPLIGDIDPTRARKALESLLHGVSSLRAQIAILDVTGVPEIDRDVADALLGAARSVRLLGAEVVLTGIRPELATTFVDLALDLGDLTTRATLEDGIAYALKRAQAGSTHQSD